MFSSVLLRIIGHMCVCPCLVASVVSDSLQSHGPTRLFNLWDSPELTCYYLEYSSKSMSKSKYRKTTFSKDGTEIEMEYLQIIKNTYIFTEFKFKYSKLVFCFFFFYILHGCSVASVVSNFLGSHGL